MLYLKASVCRSQKCYGEAFGWHILNKCPILPPARWIRWFTMLFRIAESRHAVLGE